MRDLRRCVLEAVDDDHVRALESAIDRLPQTYRVTFVLREIEGLTISETAACLAIAEDTVKTSVYRARALLRRDLADLVGEERGAFAFGAERCDRVVARVPAHISTVVTQV